MGRFEQAIAELRRAEELDPFSLETIFRSCSVFYLSRRYDEMIKQARKIFEIDPHSYVSRAFIGRAYAQKGEFSSSLAELQEARRLVGDTTGVLSMLAETYASMGRRSEAQKFLDQMQKKSQQELVPAFSLAMVYATLGDNDHAFHWLEKAYEDREEPMLGLKVLPDLDNLRSDPRFTALLKRMNLEK
jgi:tetratricopeptide (TPR) repeat protein